MGQKSKKSRRKWPLRILVLLVLAIGAGAWYGHKWYQDNLSAINPGSTKAIYFPVDNGTSPDQIAANLQQDNLIKSARAFKIYLRFRGTIKDLKAGTYTFNQSMSAPQIADGLINGKVSKNLLTILPGKTIKQIRQTFKDAGYSDAELDTAFNPAAYSDEPLLANLPAGASLEGMLYPDSFEKEATTPAATIVRESIDEMQKLVTADITTGFAAQGLSVYQGLTMASIVYQESGDPDYQPTVAQVFLLRYKQGIALGSDVTAFYAADLVGAGKTLGVDSPYNTRINTGIPPGPIGSFTVTALTAVAHPSSTDYLFFVAGDDGVLHFTHTEAEHEAATKQYCTKECS